MSYYKYNLAQGLRRVRTKTALALTALGLAVSGGGGLSLALLGTSHADSLSNINFESPTYSLANINGQDGWTKTGTYDAAVSANTSGSGTFGTQSLRLSDAVTSGSFGDQTFAKPLNDAVGEADSTAGSFSTGTLQNYFNMQFDFASAMPGAQQTAMHTTVSPDRGDGSRMSYLRFEDNAAGVDVFFDDVQGTTNPANFVETKIATLDRSVPHTVRLAMHTVDGASNDVVKVWIDGALVHTGTSWENYYRFDSEASAEQSPRIVKTVLFRESGTAHPDNAGNGFLFDNLSTQSLSTPDVTVSTPTITSPANNAVLTSAQLTHIDWTDATGTFIPPAMYEYQAYSDAGYTNLVYGSGPVLTDSQIPTPGTPNGTYYVRVRAIDTFGNQSDWSNGVASPYKITVADQPTMPTNKDQCKNNGWKTFAVFKNQGDCVSFVATNGKNQPGLH